MARVEENWNAAFEAVKSQFEVPDLLPEQRKAIRSFFQGKNVFVNIPTGFGKSLIFQCLPIVADIVHKKHHCCYLAAAIADGGPSSVFDEFGNSSYCHHK